VVLVVLGGPLARVVLVEFGRLGVVSGTVVLVVVLGRVVVVVVEGTVVVEETAVWVVGGASVVLVATEVETAVEGVLGLELGGLELWLPQPARRDAKSRSSASKGPITRQDIFALFPCLQATTRARFLPAVMAPLSVAHRPMTAARESAAERSRRCSHGTFGEVLPNSFYPVIPEACSRGRSKAPARPQSP